MRVIASQLPKIYMAQKGPLAKGKKDIPTVTCKSAYTCSGGTARIFGSPWRAPRLVWDQERLSREQGRKNILRRQKIMLISQKRTRAWKVWVTMSSSEWPAHAHHVVLSDSIHGLLSPMKG